MAAPPRLSKRFRTIFLLPFSGPPLTRTQAVVTAIALCWAVPVLVLVGVSWQEIGKSLFDPVSGATKATWAGAVASFLASVSAFGVAYWTLWSQRKNARYAGALDIAGARNLIGSATDLLISVSAEVSSYADELPQLLKEVEYLRLNITNIRADLAVTRPSAPGLSMQDTQDLYDAARANLTAKEERLQKLRDSYFDQANQIAAVRTMMESVSHSIVGAFDVRYASNLIVVRNQLYAAEMMGRRPAAAKFLTGGVAHALSALDACIQRTDLAEKYLKKLER